MIADGQTRCDIRGLVLSREGVEMQKELFFALKTEGDRGISLLLEYIAGLEARLRELEDA